MMDEQEGSGTSYLFEFWLQDYEVNELYQMTQTYDGNL